MFDFIKTLILYIYLINSSFFLAYGIHRIYLIIGFYLNKNKKAKVKQKFKKLPKVTIQIPIYNELLVVERIINKVAQIDYPRDLLQIQVLDDSTDKTRDVAKKLTQKLKKTNINIHYIHRTDRSGYKAGALNNGLKTATGEFIMIFDADFLPQKEVLHKMIHYFNDDKVGMVQAKWGHVNKDFSLLTKLQAIVLDGHLILENHVRYIKNLFFNFNGTAGMWRRKAIDDAGGWNFDTLTEDIDLSYRAQLKGWKFIYLKDLIINAELPADILGFKSQQHRWSKGIIQNYKKNILRIIKSKERLEVKMESFVHLSAASLFVILLISSIMQLPLSIFSFDFFTEHYIIKWIVFAVPTFAFCTFYFFAQVINNEKDKIGYIKIIAYLPLIVGMFVGMSVNCSLAVIEAILNIPSAFIRTPKLGDSETNLKKDNKNKFKYKSKHSYTTYFEILLGIYSILLIISTIYTLNIITFFYALICTFGFLYVGISSLLQENKKKNIY